MLDEKDLQSIAQLMEQQLAGTEERIMKNVSALMDAEFSPKFNILAEGQEAILERLDQIENKLEKAE